MQVIRWILLGLMLLPHAVLAAPPVLVVPVENDGTGGYRLWEETNGWKKAWEKRLGGREDAKVILPLGDLEDVQEVSMDTLAKGDTDGLQILAGKYRAGAVVVVEAGYKHGVLKVQMGDEEHSFTGDYDAVAEQAVDKILASLEQAPPQKKPEDAGEAVEAVLDAATVQTRQVVFPLNSIVDWVQAKGKLKNVEAIKEMEVKEVTNSYVKLNLAYMGDLAAALSAQGLTLHKQGNDWVISR